MRYVASGVPGFPSAFRPRLRRAVPEKRVEKRKPELAAGWKPCPTWGARKARIGKDWDGPGTDCQLSGWRFAPGCLAVSDRHRWPVGLAGNLWSRRLWRREGGRR